MPEVANPTNVGGQAVIEGVMMRSPGSFVVAVRRPGGEIVVRERPWRSVRERFPILKLPFLRGIVTLVETVAGGMDALSFSAEQAVEGEAENDADVKPMGKAAMAGTMALSLAFGVALFVALPHGLTWGVGELFGGLALKSVAFHLVTGAFKLLIFVSYLGLLSLMPDIKRVFMYHGAEHKAIATYEAGKPLDVEHAQTFTTFHARCGTSFLLVVVVVSIFLFAGVIPMIPGLGDGTSSHLLALAVKIPLLFPVAGLAYEFNRWTANRLDKAWVRAIATPGFMMQRLTTREPTDEMVEVALASLRAALWREEAAADAQENSVEVYESFAEVCLRLA